MNKQAKHQKILEIFLIIRYCAISIAEVLLTQNILIYDLQFIYDLVI